MHVAPSQYSRMIICRAQRGTLFLVKQDVRRIDLLPRKTKMSKVKLVSEILNPRYLRLATSRYDVVPAGRVVVWREDGLMHIRDITMNHQTFYTTGRSMFISLTPAGGLSSSGKHVPHPRAEPFRTLTRLLRFPCSPASNARGLGETRQVKAHGSPDDHQDPSLPQTLVQNSRRYILICKCYFQVIKERHAHAARCQSATSEAGMALAHGRTEEPTRSGSRAIVIGGGLAGLASARVLSDLFDEVLLLERDSITQQARIL